MAGLRVTDEGLPCMGAEDFAYFTQKVPGCFWFIGSKPADHQGDIVTCHSNHYDFNDDIIPQAVEVFLRLLEQRFNVTLGL